MPASIFPVLNNLYQKHLRKLELPDCAFHYDKQVMALKGVLGESYPARMTLGTAGRVSISDTIIRRKNGIRKKEEENNG